MSVVNDMNLAFQGGLSGGCLSGDVQSRFGVDIRGPSFPDGLLSIDFEQLALDICADGVTMIATANEKLNQKRKRIQFSGWPHWLSLP